MRCIIQEWVSPDLLMRNQYGPTKEPCITFKVRRDEFNTIWIEIIARHGSYGELRRVTPWPYLSIAEINEYELINQLFNTLTFIGSPYYWSKTHFKKKVEVAE